MRGFRALSSKSSAIDISDGTEIPFDKKYTPMFLEIGNEINIRLHEGHRFQSQKNREENSLAKGWSLNTSWAGGKSCARVVEWVLIRTLGTPCEGKGSLRRLHPSR